MNAGPRGAMITAQPTDAGLVRRLTAKARVLAEARRDRRLHSPRALWPLFTGDRHA